jgi:predicted ATPase
LQLAARRRDDLRDGAWLVELAPLAQPELLAEAVADTVGVPLRTRAAPEAVLAEALAGRELLLVLDNCEHLVGACAQLAEALLRRLP